jgi:divalent metal cation (Fe/Co/Zn/Cd) transporter
MQSRSEVMKALAEDHLNDVMSNAGAIVSAIIVRFVPGAWWVDAAAAIAISAVIMARWTRITWQQVGGAAGGSLRRRPLVGRAGRRGLRAAARLA